MDIAFNVSSSFVRFRPSTNKPPVQLQTPSTSSAGPDGSAQVPEERPRRWVDTAEVKRPRPTKDSSCAAVSWYHCASLWRCAVVETSRVSYFSFSSEKSARSSSILALSCVCCSVRTPTNPRKSPVADEPTSWPAKRKRDNKRRILVERGVVGLLFVCFGFLTFLRTEKSAGTHKKNERTNTVPKSRTKQKNTRVVEGAVERFVTPKSAFVFLQQENENNQEQKKHKTKKNTATKKTATQKRSHKTNSHKKNSKRPPPPPHADEGKCFRLARAWKSESNDSGCGETNQPTTLAEQSKTTTKPQTHTHAHAQEDARHAREVRL